MDCHSDSEDSLEVIAKSWKRVIDAAYKNGYQEGIKEGAQMVFQKNFDRGYNDGFKAAFQLGKYKGHVAACSNDFKHPDHIADILDKTRRGACHICTLESKKQKDEDSNFLSVHFLDNHRKGVASTLKICRMYFKPFMKGV